jgi:hypothetical protein
MRPVFGFKISKQTGQINGAKIKFVVVDFQALCSVSVADRPPFLQTNSSAGRL